MTRTRVLHVVGGLGLGGGEKLTMLVATGLDRARFDVAVLNLGVPGPFSERIRESGIPVVDIGLPLQPSILDLPQLAKGLIRISQVIFTRPRWDIVHTHMFRTAVICGVLARLAGIRLFGTMHRTYYRWQPLIERLIGPLHEAIVVDSAAVGVILQARNGISEDRFAVIHNGVDTGEFDAAPSGEVARETLGLPMGCTVVTEVAHFQEHKGQRHLIRAFAAVSEATDRLLLVGDGPTRESLEADVLQRGLAERIIFTGPRSDLAVVLAATDVLALPSTFEGFGIIQAEAMYLGIPVIGTDRGGATEVVVDGVTGFLVPFGDENKLAARLRQLIESAELRWKMGSAGRERVRSFFTQDRMCRRYADLYEGTITRGLQVVVDDL